MEPGIITAEIVPAGTTEPVVIGPADLSIVEGVSLIVYAVGSLDAGNLTILTQSIDGLGATPTVVNTGNSPVDDGLPTTLALGVAAGIAFFGFGVACTRRSALVRS